MRDRSGFDLTGRGESDRGDADLRPRRLPRLHRREPRLRQRRHRQPAGPDPARRAARARQRHAEPRRRRVQAGPVVLRRRRRPRRQLLGPVARGRAVAVRLRLPRLRRHEPGRRGPGPEAPGTYDLVGDVAFRTGPGLRRVQLRQRGGRRGRPARAAAGVSESGAQAGSGRAGGGARGRAAAARRVRHPLRPRARPAALDQGRLPHTDLPAAQGRAGARRPAQARQGRTPARARTRRARRPRLHRQGAGRRDAAPAARHPGEADDDDHADAATLKRASARTSTPLGGAAGGSTARLGSLVIAMRSQSTPTGLLGLFATCLC